MNTIFMIFVNEMDWHWQVHNDETDDGLYCSDIMAIYDTNETDTTCQIYSMKLAYIIRYVLWNWRE